MMSPNVQPDTRLNWRAIAELARPVVLPDRANPATATTPAPWDLPSHPPDARERLTEYLNTWASMDESAWPEANVKALHEDIMDIFRDHPVEADTWFREWRAAHPEARW